MVLISLYGAPAPAFAAINQPVINSTCSEGNPSMSWSGDAGTGPAAWQKGFYVDISDNNFASYGGGHWYHKQVPTGTTTNFSGFTEFSGPGQPEGSVLSIQKNKTYYLQISNLVETSTPITFVFTQDCQINPAPPAPPTITFSANQTNIPYGSATNLTWSVSPATATCNGYNGWLGGKPNVGQSSTGNLISNTTYELRCYKTPGGMTRAFVTVTVDPPLPPTVNFQVSAPGVPANTTITVAHNTTATLTWSSSNASSCSSGGSWSGTPITPNVSGTTTKGPLPGGTYYDYIITCLNPAGVSVSKQVRINVNAPSTPPPGPAPAPGPAIPFSQSHGVFFLGGTPPHTGSFYHFGDLSVYNWLVSNEYYQPTTNSALTISYLQLLAAQGATGTAPSPINCNASCTFPQSGVYLMDSSLTLTSPITISSGKKIILLVKGSADIQNTIKTDTSSVFILAAKDDITINRLVQQPASNTCQQPGQLQGIFSAGKDFIVDGAGQSGCAPGGTPDGMLIIDGTVITNASRTSNGSFIPNRDLCGGNINYPAVVITQRPDFILNLPDFAKKQSLIYKEVTP